MPSPNLAPSTRDFCQRACVNHILMGCAPTGTRPRDLRSSFITLRVYEGVPLTQIAKEVGTSIAMIEQHYASVIANWDGKQRSAEASMRAARQTIGRKMDGKADVD